MSLRRFTRTRFFRSAGDGTAPDVLVDVQLVAADRLGDVSLVLLAGVRLGPAQGAEAERRLVVPQRDPQRDGRGEAGLPGRGGPDVLDAGQRTGVHAGDVACMGHPAVPGPEEVQ